MTVNVGDLDIKVKLNTSEFNSGVSSVKSGLGGISSGIVEVNQALEVLSKAWNVAASAAKALAQSGMKIQALNNTFKAITGSSEEAAEEMSYIRETCNKMGLEFDTASQAYKGLAAAAHGTSLEGEGARKIFEAVAGAATVLGLSSDQTNGALLALQQMISKGKVSAEELRQQLGERLPGASKLAAEAMGMSTAKFEKLMASGKILAEDFIPKFAAKLEEVYGKQMKIASDTSLVANLNRVSNSWEQLKQTVAGDDFMGGSTNFLKSLNDAMQSQDVTQAAQEIGTALGDMANNVASKMPEIAKWVEDAIGEIRSFVSDMKVIFDELYTTISGVIDSIFGSEMYQKIVNFISPITQAIARFKGEIKEGYGVDLDKSPLGIGTDFRKSFANYIREKNGISTDAPAPTPATQPAPVKKKSPPKQSVASDDGKKKGGTSAADSAITNLRKKIADLKSDINSADMGPFAKAFEQAKSDVEEMGIQLEKALGKGIKTDKIKELLEEFKKLRMEKVDAEFIGKLTEKTREFNEAADAVDLSPYQQELNKVLAEVEGLSLESEKAAAATDKLTKALNRKYAAQYNNEAKEYATSLSAKKNGARAEALQDLLSTYEKETKGNTSDAVKEAAFNKLYEGIKEKSYEFSQGKYSFAERFTNVISDSSQIKALQKLREEAGFTDEQFKKLSDTLDGAFNFSSISSAVSEFAEIVSGPLTDALVTMATTGEVNFSKVGSAILKGVISYATQQALELSMIAAYEGIMQLIDPEQKYSTGGKSHAEKATGALMGAGVMAGFAAAATAGLALSGGWSGQAHDGISAIPEDGTWLLKKGERVVNDKDNTALTNMVRNWQSSAKPNVNMTVNINGGDEEGVKKSLPNMKKAIIEAVTADIASNGQIRKTIQNYT